MLALGKPTQHVATAKDCAACHGTITWAAATFSHLGLNEPCRSCHNGINAIGKQIQHVSTTLDCGSCHSTLNWTTLGAPAPRRPVVPSPRGATSGQAK